MLHSTKQKFFLQLIFHYLQNVFAGQFWPADRSFENGFTGGWIASRVGFGPRAVVWRPCYRRISAENWSEWRWAFSFHGVETWLLLRIICGTKRLNAFSDYTRPVRYFRSVRVYLLLLFMGKIRGKDKNSLHCSYCNDADIQWRKMHWRICAKWRQWQGWSVRPF